MDNRKRVDAKINTALNTHHINLPVLSWEEEHIFYVYAPALDLTGYGTTEIEAEESFSTTLTEFVKYTENKKTLYKELEKLGWTVNQKKKRIHPPELEKMLEDNQTFRELKDMPGVISSSKNIELAVA